VDNLTDPDDNFIIRNFTFSCNFAGLFEVVYSDFLFAKTATVDYNITLFWQSNDFDSIYIFVDFHIHFC